MRHLALLVLVLPGCAAGAVTGPPVVVSPAPDPQAGRGIRAVAHVAGTADFQVLATGPGGQDLALTAFYNINGKAVVTVRPTKPFLYIEVGGSATVTPAPGLEAEAQDGVDSGDVAIVRNGLRSGLDPLEPLVVPEEERARRAPPPPPSPIPVVPK